MNEVWKPIREFERYEVSNLGRVRSLITGTILKPRLARNGYLRVNLRIGDVKYEKPKVRHVHRLVAEQFIDCKSSEYQVNHINGNKCDNRAENLEWISPSDNIKHAIQNGLISEQILEMNIKNITSKESRMKSDESHKTDQYAEKMRRINHETGVTRTIIQSDPVTNEIIKTFDNAHEAGYYLFEKEFTTQDRLITRVCRAKKGKAYGYRWEYGE